MLAGKAWYVLYKGLGEHRETTRYYLVLDLEHWMMVGTERQVNFH